jgi:hypothetical protein
MMPGHKLLLLIALLFLSGCSIVRTVDPITTKISDICIKRNPKVFMAGFLPELQTQIESYGISTRVFDDTAPNDCPFQLRYTANWAWDVTMYLTYAEIAVYENVHKQRIGRGIYDARDGGGRLDKFGPTANKLKTITEPLFGHGASVISMQ